MQRAETGKLFKVYDGDNLIDVYLANNEQEAIAKAEAEHGKLNNPTAKKAPDSFHS